MPLIPDLPEIVALHQPTLKACGANRCRMEKYRTACAPDQVLPYTGRQFIIGCRSVTIADHRVQQETGRRMVCSKDNLKERTLDAAIISAGCEDVASRAGPAAGTVR
jgi:hypothetical protein